MITVAGTTVPVDVLHRLALGVEPFDHVTSLRTSGVRVDEELPRVDGRDVGSVGVDPAAVPSNLRPFEAKGGRYKLRHGPRVRRAFVVRVHDPLRRYVPRRFDVRIWPTPDIRTAADPNDVVAIDDDPPRGIFIPVLSRVLRPWLLPGSAYRLPRTSTGIRGRVRCNGVDVRWPRVKALIPATGEVVGRAHGDDRGEFLLLLSRGGGPVWPPAGGKISVELVVSARPTALLPPDEQALAARRHDPFADLPVEFVPRSANSPSPSDLDSPLLRGESDPPDYIQSSAVVPRPTETLDVGRVLFRQAPYEFHVP